MKTSVFTPVHAPYAAWIMPCYQSLVDQTDNDWEWVVGLNGGLSKLPDAVAADKRVRAIPLSNDQDGVPHNRIGRMKGELCEACVGDVLVELDVDDLLTPNALEWIKKAFSDESVVFAYSNSAQFTEDWNSPIHSSYWGWKHRFFEWNSHPLFEQIAWPPGPHSFRRIEWAPNHVRAWRASSYREVGGHNRELLCGDDHDLVCRFYVKFGADRIRHMDQCLYLYRVHGDNTCGMHKSNAIIQRQVGRNYLNYVYPMAERWAQDNQLKMIDLGGRINPKDGYTTVDVVGADIDADLNYQWPFETSEIGVLRAHHVLEHLEDLIHVFNEAYRVLAPGGWFFVEFPSAVGKGAFRDPTHRQYMVDQTLWYFTNRNYARYIQPEFTGRFQASRIETYLMEPHVPVVAAELICLKPPYSTRPAGEVLI